MANQHTGNFGHVVKDKFKCTAKEILLKCQVEGLSYQDAEKVLGFKHVTIRKLAKRFDIKLPVRFTIMDDGDTTNQSVEYINSCKLKSIDKTNVFSRCWINMNLYSAIKAKS